METMTKKERNAAILEDLIGGATRERVVEKYGVKPEKVEDIIAKAADKAQKQADEVAAALGLKKIGGGRQGAIVTGEPEVALKEPVPKNAAGRVTRKAVPAKVSRLNPDVTERMKVRAINEARTVRDLEDRTKAARKRRNDTIRSLCDRGLSEREVGELVGMTGPRINQIYFGTNGSRS